MRTLARIALSALLLLPAAAAAKKVVAAPPAPVQYTVRAAEVEPYRPKSGKLEARVLVDEQRVGPTQASLTLLSLDGRTELPLHRQTSSKVIVVLEGGVKVKGLGKALHGGKGEDLGPGDAAYVPAGVASGLVATCCKRAPTKVLVLYAPAGPERPYRDPAAAKTVGTTPVAAAEKQAAPADAPQPRIAHVADVPALTVANGKGVVKILFDAASAGEGTAAVSHVEFLADAAVPEHVHGQEDETLWIIKGQGEMTIAGETLPVEAGMAIHVPAGIRHAFKTAGGVTAVQFYTPAGPEQRFKQAAAPAPAPTPAAPPAPAKPAPPASNPKK